MFYFIFYAIILSTAAALEPIVETSTFYTNITCAEDFCSDSLGDFSLKLERPPAGFFNMKIGRNDRRFILNISEYSHMSIIGANADSDSPTYIIFYSGKIAYIVVKFAADFTTAAVFLSAHIDTNNTLKFQRLVSPMATFYDYSCGEVNIVNRFSQDNVTITVGDQCIKAGTKPLNFILSAPDIDPAAMLSCRTAGRGADCSQVFIGDRLHQNSPPGQSDFAVIKFAVLPSYENTFSYIIAFVRRIPFNDEIRARFDYIFIHKF